MYLFLYFLNFILSIVLEDHIVTSVLLCALMCLSSVNIIFICIIMFYQINSLTKKRVGKLVDLLYMLCRGCGKSFVVCSFCVFT